MGTDVALLDALMSLPEDTNPRWPPEIALKILTLDGVRTRLVAVLEDETLGASIRFSALYALLADLRRKKDYTVYEQTLQRYRPAFDGRPMMALLDSQMHLNRYPDRTEVSIALHLAQKAYDALPHHFGVTAHLAECIACVGETGGQPRKTDIRTGLELLDRAMAAEGGTYARYWVTRAKLDSLLQQYESALCALDKAIDLEPSSHPNYVIRIGDYQAVRLSIQARRDLSSFGEAVAKAAQSAEEVRYQVITALGVLTAAITFIVTATQIATHFAFGPAARLILIAAGAVAVMFGAFAVLSSSQNYVRTVISVALGALLIGGGVLGSALK